VAVIV
jgi:hypothetical protein